MAPAGVAWEQAVAYWSTLKTDEGAQFDKVIQLKAETLHLRSPRAPARKTWLASTTLSQPLRTSQTRTSKSPRRAADYMGLSAGTPMTDVKIDAVFIGSCTNGRIEDFREVAKVVEGKKVADDVRTLLVPGSGLVKQQAEEEGLDKIFIEAGFDWREPGCSMCLAMNADKLAEGERAAVEPKL